MNEKRRRQFSIASLLMATAFIAAVAAILAQLTWMVNFLRIAILGIAIGVAALVLIMRRSRT